MSSRALKRAQREIEEKKIAAQLKHDDSDDEIVSASASNSKPGAFALLGEVDDEDEDEESEARSADHIAESEVEKQPIAQKAASVAAVPSSTSKPSKKKKKKGKSSRQSASKEENIDELLDSLARNAANAKGDDSGTAANGATGNNDFYSLLAVESSNLHVLNEMRKLFGRDAVEAERRETQQAGRGHGRQIGQQPNRLAAIARRRNIFVQGKEEWPSAPSGGLGMEVVEKRDNGVVEFRFVHSTAYQDTQRQFEIAVASMDPQRLVAMLQHAPYHVATLSQVSEIAKHQGDQPGAGELLERALFSFGRSIHSTFATKLSEGKARLDFRRPENREFALVVWRYMENLKLRATWKTVFEWSKLLFALDPVSDPYCQALVLDQYALRARQSEHLIQIADNPNFQKTLQTYGKPSPFYGFEASISLACFQAGEQGAAEKRLQQAALKCPWLYSALYKELQIELIPPAIWGKLPPSQGDELLVTMYVDRTKDIWNTPEVTSFLITALKDASRPPAYTDADLTAATTEQECFKEEAFIRHVILSEKPQWIGMLPQKPDQDSLRASDPVPPVDNLESYHVELPQARVVDEAQAMRILEQIQQLALIGGRRRGEPGHERLEEDQEANWAEEVDEDGVWDE